MDMINIFDIDSKGIPSFLYIVPEYDLYGVGLIMMYGYEMNYKL